MVYPCVTGPAGMFFAVAARMLVTVISAIEFEVNYLRDFGEAQSSM